MRAVERIRKEHWRACWPRGRRPAWRPERSCPSTHTRLRQASAASRRCWTSTPLRPPNYRPGSSTWRCLCRCSRQAARTRVRSVCRQMPTRLRWRQPLPGGGPAAGAAPPRQGACACSSEWRLSRRWRGTGGCWRRGSCTARSSCLAQRRRRTLGGWVAAALPALPRRCLAGAPSPPRHRLGRRRVPGPSSSQLRSRRTRSPARGARGVQARRRRRLCSTGMPRTLSQGAVQVQGWVLHPAAATALVEQTLP